MYRTILILALVFPAASFALCDPTTGIGCGYGFFLPSYATPAPDSEFARARDFIETNVIGKRTQVRWSGESTRPPAQYDMEISTTYKNLQVFGGEMTFDLDMLVKGVLYRVENGRRTSVQLSRSEQVIRRVHIGWRASTNKMIGFFNNPVEPSASVRSLQADFADNRLTLKMATVGYGDLKLGENPTVPGAFESTFTYALDQGNLVVTKRTDLYRVDPATMVRTLVETGKEIVETEVP